MLSEVDGFMMHETVAMANGMITMNATAGIQRLAAKNCPWSKHFDADYSNKRVVGSGATACVYLAEDSTGKTVALKVGKGGEGESLSQWKNECKEMQLLRVRACKSTKRPVFGDTVYKLNRQFIPTCMGVGSIQEDNVNYYIMHAAGTKIISDVTDDEYTLAQRKSLFAQFVGAVYAMHALDTSHNDLHGGNIVIDETGANPELALIDFGEIVQPLDPTSPLAGGQALQTWLFDYKRDGNAIWAFSSLLAKCPSFPSFPVIPPSRRDLSELQEEFLACMKSEWGASDKDISAMSKVLENDISQFPDQAIAGLFKSKLVQDNLPKFKNIYGWKATDNCDSWDISKITAFEREVTYGAMYKCETVPTYNKITWKTRKDGRKVKKTSQNCKFARSACYTLINDVTWSCDSGTIKGSPCDSVHLSKRSGHPDKTFDGGCLSVNHVEGYKYAQVYPGYVAPDPSSQPKYKKPAYTPLATTTKRPVVKCDPNMPVKCKCSKTGTVNGVVTGKAGCKFHLSRSYGAFCYIEGASECAGAKFSAKKGVYFRSCSSQCEK